MTSLSAMPSPSHDSPAEEEWLSVSDAARLLGVNVDTVRRWADDDTLPHWRPPGARRHRRFRKSDVVAFRDASQKASAS